MNALVIGAGTGADIPKGADVIVLPGETVPVDVDATFHRVTSLPECLKTIRLRYAKHDQIALLGGTRIIADHKIDAEAIRAEWMPSIDNQLEIIIDDLGNCPMDSWDGARNAIKQGHYLETCPNTSSLYNSLVGKPAICLGAGPSGQHYLSRINPDTHFVFCTDVMAKGCGFVPHYICLLERLAANLDVIGGMAGNGSRLIALPVADPRAARAFNGKCLWWIGADSLYYWLAPGILSAYAGRSCGVLSVAAALLAGCNPIYLIGHDLAYDNGVSHSLATHPMAPLEHQGPESTDSHIYHQRRFLVEANNGGKVETCGLWQIFRQDIEHIISFFPDRTIINCGGLSHIAGTVMGDLAPSYWTVREPEFIIKPIKNRLPDVPRMIYNMRRIQDRCEEVLKGLSTGTDTAVLELMMRVSRMVDSDLALMFNYVFRAISNNLNLRLQYRMTHGYDHEQSARSVLRTLAVTMHAMCDRMAVDLVA